MTSWLTIDEMRAYKSNNIISWIFVFSEHCEVVVVNKHCNFNLVNTMGVNLHLPI